MDLSQYGSGSFKRIDFTMPTLLRNTSLWSMALERELLPEEGWHSMGSRVFSMQWASQIKVALKFIPGSQHAPVLGNTMDAVHCGAVVLFCLGGTTFWGEPQIGPLCEFDAESSSSE